MKKDIGEKEIIEYFLGGLSDKEADSFEELYFTDESVFELMEIEEDRLIEKYVNNRLSATDKDRFEKHYLVSPQRYEKVQEHKLFAEFITKYRGEYLPEEVEVAKAVASTNGKEMVRNKQKSFFATVKEMFDQSFTLRLSFAVGLTVIISIPLTLVIFSLQKKLEQTQVKLAKTEEQILTIKKEKEQKEKEQVASAEKIQELEKDLENAKKLNVGLESVKKNDTSLTSTIASFLLIPGLSSRSEGQKQNEVVLLPNVKTAKIQLKLDTNKTSEYKTFEIIIKDIDGNIIEPGKIISISNTNAKILGFDIPSLQLKTSNYILILNGISDGGAKVKDLDVYRFSVENKSK